MTTEDNQSDGPEDGASDVEPDLTSPETSRPKGRWASLNDSYRRYLVRFGRRESN